MNVTVSLPEELCKKARHRAVDSSMSLSAWLAELVRREVELPVDSDGRAKNWADAFSTEHPEWFYERELPLEDRASGRVRQISFEAEE